MDDELARRFFLQPTQTLQRHYDILRAYFVEQRTIDDLAATCGMNYYTVRALVRRFRAQCQDGQVPPFSLSPARDAPPRNRGGRAFLLKQRPLPIAGSCG